MKPATSEFFYKRSDTKDWLFTICKTCKDIYNRKNYEKNKKRYLEDGKRRYHKNYDKIREQAHIRYENNKEQYLIKNREYYQNHKERYKENMDARNKRMWYKNIHKKVWRFIEKHNLRPDWCYICWKKCIVDFHHPNYKKEYEWVFVCRSCHNRIHSWAVVCPKPTNLLELLD